MADQESNPSVSDIRKKFANQSSKVPPVVTPKPGPRPSVKGKPTGATIPQPPIPKARTRPEEEQHKSPPTSPPANTPKSPKEVPDWQKELRHHLIKADDKAKGEVSSTLNRPPVPVPIPRKPSDPSEPTQSHHTLPKTKTREDGQPNLGGSKSASSLQTPLKDMPNLGGSKSPSSQNPPPVPSSPIPGTQHLPQYEVQKVILSTAVNSKLDLRNVDIDKLNHPHHHPHMPYNEPKPKELTDLSKLPVGTPHWQDEVREHLEFDAEEVKGAKEKKAHRWYQKKTLNKFKKTPKKREESIEAPTANIGLLDLDSCDGNTDLERLVFSGSLPRIVQIKNDFSTPDCSLSLQKNKELMMHFTAPIYRVHAMDADRKELWMPVHSKLRFERLLVDPRHDDKVFIGTTALAEAKPLPAFVRVIAGHDGGEISNTVEVDDIIEISHVELDRDSKGNSQKVVIGKIGEQYVHLGEDLNYAEYTTMLSEEFVPMSELVKNNFPQRVRVVDTEGQIRLPKRERHLKLLSYDKETHVICTQPNEKRVISIPLTCPVKLAPMTGDWVKCRQSLPAIYPLVNFTWHVYDLGRPDLEDNYRQIAQPMPEIMKDWMQSYEGKQISVDVAERHVQDLKDRIGDLKRENRMHMDRLREGTSDNSELPLPPRPLGTGEAPPARPPKSDALKKKPKSALNRSVSDGGLLKTTVSKNADSDEDDYESIPGDDDGYETPKGTLARLNKKVDPIEEQTVLELKNLLEKKEEDIRNAKIKGDHLQKKCDILEEEKGKLEKKANEYAIQIRQLQMEIDHALQRGDDIYDSIDPAPIIPDNQIYNSPVDLRGVNNMSTEQVCDLLRELDLSGYVDSFKKEQVDGSLLEGLEETILKEDLRMTGLHARKLKMAVNKRSKPGVNPHDPR